MSENNTDVSDVPAEGNQAAKPETDAVNNSDAKNDAVSEPPAKKAKQESRKNKGPHQSVDELAAAEAKAVCGSVDTSTGRQLRKREPAKVEPKKEPAKSKKEPASKKKETVVNKKEPAKKEPAAKKGRGAKSKDQDEEKDSGSAAENSADAEKEEDKAEEKEKKDDKKEDEVAEKPTDTETKSVEEPKVVAEDSTSSNNATAPATAENETTPPKTE